MISNERGRDTAGNAFWLSSLLLCGSPVGCGEKLNVGWNDIIDAGGPAATQGVATIMDAPPIDGVTFDAAARVEADAAPPAPDAAPASDADLPLPFDSSAPIIVNNDGPFDNWLGEHAVLSLLDGRQLVGLIINDSWAWPNLDSNLAGWQELVSAARADGLGSVPVERGHPTHRFGLEVR